MTWLLLIYTVPSEPSRARAAVWRALKQAGAIYLRDGVVVLPEREETRDLFQAIAAKVEMFSGQATLVEGARLDSARAEAIAAQARASRAEEYAEIGREAEWFLARISREWKHRELTPADVKTIAKDLGTLQRWAAQVRARDHFSTPAATVLDDQLRRCQHVLAGVLAEPACRTSEAVA